MKLRQAISPLHMVWNAAPPCHAKVYELWSFLRLLCSTVALASLPVLRGSLPFCELGSNFSFIDWQLCQPRVLLLPVWSNHDSRAAWVCHGERWLQGEEWQPLAICVVMAVIWKGQLLVCLTWSVQCWMEGRSLHSELGWWAGAGQKLVPELLLGA